MIKLGKADVKELLRWLSLVTGMALCYLSRYSFLLFIPGFILLWIGFAKVVDHITERKLPIYLDHFKSLLQQGTREDDQYLSPATDEEVVDYVNLLLNVARRMDPCTKMLVLDQSMRLLRNYRPWIHKPMMASLQGSMGHSS